MEQTMTIERLMDLKGSPVYSSDGEPIGDLEGVFYDDDTRRPEWIALGTGFFGTKRVLVPVEGARFDEDGITVPYTKDHVKDSPDIDEESISEATEQELYAYYGLRAGAPETATKGRGRAADREASVTRSEEELRVGKRDVEAGRVRLRKWVETEPVETDVELRRETARVERERIDQPVSGAELGEQEIEVPLRAEEAVVQKDTVAKERISVEKDVEADRETVADELRKERVEIDDEGKKRR